METQMKRKTTPAPADNPELEKLVNRYSRESRILNPRGARGIENFMNFNDPQVIRTELIEHKGNQSGEYWNPGRLSGSRSSMHTAVLPSLLDARKALQAMFETYQKSEVAIGNRPPKTWPSNLLDEKIILDAKIRVTELEIEKLEELLKPLEEKKEAEQNEPLARKHWARCELHDGRLVKMAGWRVGFPENEEILHILEGPFANMPCWMFKSQILKAIQSEESYRRRQELKAAEAEERRPRPVAKVLTPTWNPESKQISYEGYSNATIKRIKVDM